GEQGAPASPPLRAGGKRQPSEERGEDGKLPALLRAPRPVEEEGGTAGGEVLGAGGAQRVEERAEALGLGPVGRVVRLAARHQRRRGRLSPPRRPHGDGPPARAFGEEAGEAREV